MFGTDLDTAYYEKPSYEKNAPENNIQTNKDPTHTKSSNVIFSHEKHDETHNDTTDDTNSIEDLKRQLRHQKDINTIIQRDAISVYDRFLSKKKDVMKLVCISLTVLLAISLHFVLSDLIKNYIMNNHFTESKETIIKIMYPVGVFGMVWAMKVFSK
jgi:hypothetical protein